MIVTNEMWLTGAMTATITYTINKVIRYHLRKRRPNGIAARQHYILGVCEVMCALMLAHLLCIELMHPQDVQLNIATLAAMHYILDQAVGAFIEPIT
jgi:hypothetical protein